MIDVGSMFRNLQGGQNISDHDLDTALDAARREYIDRHPSSLEHLREAAKYLPGGNTRTVLFHDPFPLRIVSAKGCRIRDVDGHEYVNFLGEYTAGMFGHDNRVIREAVVQALDNGISLSGHCPDEARLAQLICDRFSSVERVRFTNSGTEANLLAVSAARHFTARRRVLVFRGAYHGGLLSFAHGESPVNAPYDYLVGTYNDSLSTRELIRSHAGEIACILVEPVQGAGGCIPARVEFLEMLRDEARDAGIVLIFDEVMTSRLSFSGLQGRYGIIPDMSTFGKYLGGGLTFGAFGGKSEIMDLFDPSRPDGLPHAGTFNNNVLTMAAGVAALDGILTEERLSELNLRGESMRDALNETAAREGIAIRFTGLGSLIGVHATADPVLNADDLKDADDRILELVFLDMLKRGFYFARRGFISLMLTIGDEEVDGFVESFGEFARNRQGVARTGS